MPIYSGDFSMKVMHYYTYPENSGGPLTYIKNIIWLTPEEFEERYPKAKYPMINEKRDIVINYMKEKHGINLIGISYGSSKQ